MRSRGREELTSQAKMPLRLSDFDYRLPGDRIAQQPVSPRDRSRLMVLHRETGRTDDFTFKDIPEILEPGSLLVANDTLVVPAKFECRRSSGGRIEGLFLREVSPGRWEALLKGAGRCRKGEELAFPADAGLRARLVQRAGGAVWQLEIDPPAPALEALERVGRTPLPPYIRRPGGLGDDEEDRRAYQTVFASKPGAVAAPTAGLHFTQSILEALRQRGISLVHVTLHVGLGTFAPVRAERIEEHRMHAEYYRIGQAAAEAVLAAKREHRRVVAVGTTSVRVLETAAAGGLAAGEGWTELFIRPPAEFRIVDALLTNFHLPRSTLLMLVAAFCSPGWTHGAGMILAAYRQALERGYRFYSYGDAMLIV